MDEKKFDQWVKNMGVSESIASVLKNALTTRSNADELVGEMVTGNLTGTQAMKLLASKKSGPQRQEPTYHPVAPVSDKSERPAKPTNLGPSTGQHVELPEALQKALAAQQAKVQVPTEPPPMKPRSAADILASMNAGSGGGKPVEDKKKKKGLFSLPKFKKDKKDGGQPAAFRSSAGFSGSGGKSLRRRGGGKKGTVSNGVIIFAVIILLVLAGIVLAPSLIGGGSANQAAPTQSITNAPPSQKEAFAQGQVDSAIPSDFMRPPTSVADFFANFPWNWLLYLFCGVIILSLVISERQESREFMDVTSAVVGNVQFFVVVCLVTILANAIAGMGWATAAFATNFILGMSLLINIILQVFASITGYRDYSNLSTGVFISGMLFMWRWYPADKVYWMIGIALMLLGIAIEIFEIKRSRSATKSIIGSMLMLVTFVAGFLFVYALIQSSISGTPFTADAAQLAKASSWVVFLGHAHVLLSVLLGLGVAALVGRVYGAIWLRPEQMSHSGGGQVEGSISTVNDNFLTFDSIGLFVMILVLFLPWLGLLPHVAMLFLP